eukprot:4958903-Prorocentrum_lima.AAC.1
MTSSLVGSEMCIRDSNRSVVATMHSHLGAPGPTARGSMIDEVRGNRSAPRTAPTTLLNAGERD